MTITLAVKVGDGVVLGADSAVTIPGRGVYFNAEKIFNVVKGAPIGAAFYGLGGLDGRSVTALSKELRERLRTGYTSQDGVDWRFNKETYTIEWVTSRIKEFFYDELYSKEYPPSPTAPVMGFRVAGFSAHATKPELWTLMVGPGGACTEPTLEAGPDVVGVVWAGAPEPLNRLVSGWSGDTLARLMQAGMTHADATALLTSQSDLTHPAMPIQDAIDLVAYLSDVTARYYRFAPGDPIVAPPIDIATITRHEGFKWVRRKHYFPPELNPPV